MGTLGRRIYLALDCFACHGSVEHPTLYLGEGHVGQPPENAFVSCSLSVVNTAHRCPGIRLRTPSLSFHSRLLVGCRSNTRIRCPPRLPFSACLYSTSQGRSTFFYSWSSDLNFSSSILPSGFVILKSLINLPTLRYWPKRQIITTARNQQGGNLQVMGNGIRLVTPTRWCYHPSSLLGQGWRIWKAFDGRAVYTANNESIVPNALFLYETNKAMH